MSRMKPAVFEFKDASGETLRVRCGPLGFEVRTRNGVPVRVGAWSELVSSAPVAQVPVAQVPTSSSQSWRFVHCGPNKIAVIKAIRHITDLRLKEAKDLSESPWNFDDLTTIAGDKLSEDKQRELLNAIRKVGGVVAQRC